MATKQRFSVKIDQLLGRHQEHSDSRTLGILFRTWAKAIATQNEIRTVSSPSLKESCNAYTSPYFCSCAILS